MLQVKITKVKLKLASMEGVKVQAQLWSGERRLIIVYGSIQKLNDECWMVKSKCDRCEILLNPEIDSMSITDEYINVFLK